MMYLLSRLAQIVGYTLCHTLLSMVCHGHIFLQLAFGTFLVQGSILAAVLVLVRIPLLHTYLGEYSISRVYMVVQRQSASIYSVYIS